MLNIAIDGPAGAGKSTIAKAVSKKLGIVYLDTGAMYRGAAYAALKRGLDVNDASQIEPFLSGLEMSIDCGDVQQIIVNGENVTPFIREHRISKAASDISKLPAVRLKLVELQREIAGRTACVLDGRDIGSYVLPDAEYKFFVTASPEERANRRFKELREKGSDLTYEEILADIKDRDYNDSHRAFAPLVQVADARLIDTTALTVDEAVNAVLRIIEGEK